MASAVGDKRTYDEMSSGANEATQVQNAVIQKAKQYQTPPEGAQANATCVFSIWFYHPQNLKHMVDIVSNILTECEFTVTSSGIDLKQHDPDGSRLLSCHLDAIVDTVNDDPHTGEAPTFKISSKTLATLLKRAVSAQDVLGIYKYSTSDDIVLQTYDPTNTNNWNYFLLTTMDSDGPTEQLDLSDFEYSYTVDIQLKMFDQIIKTSREMKIDEIKFAIYEPDEEQAARSGLRSTYFVITLENQTNGKLNWTFHSRTAWEPSEQFGIVIKTADVAQDDGTSRRGLDIKNMRNPLAATYNTEIINDFIKSMDRNMLTIHFLKDEDGVMMFQYPLGGDNSFLRVVVAPRIAIE